MSSSSLIPHLKLSALLLRRAAAVRTSAALAVGAQRAFSMALPSPSSSAATSSSSSSYASSPSSSSSSASSAPPVSSSSSSFLKKKWSGLYTFAGPEADFQVAADIPWMPTKPQQEQQQQQAQESKTTTTKQWSETLSFASPESDFCDTSREQAATTTVANDNVWSETLSFASPESDFYDTSREQAMTTTTTVANETWSDTLSFASPESDFNASLENVSVSGEEQVQVQLPRLFKEALQVQDQAVVITTAQPPFTVVHVNHAWTELCGYAPDEAVHKTVPDLLQGPESNTVVASHMIRRVLDQQAADDAYLVNYTKSGRLFYNHVSVGPLYMEDAAAASPQFLIGILQEVKKEQVPLRLVNAA